MKKGKNVMKNKKATNKNIQKKAMRDKKKKALARLKKAAVDLKKKAPRHLKDKKNLKRPAAGDTERKMKGPRTPILKGPLCPDVSVTAGEGYYKLFKVTCMIVPPRYGSSRSRIVVGASNMDTGPLLEVRGHVVGENSRWLQRPRTSILKGPLMPDASLMPEEENHKPFQLTCMVIPPKASICLLSLLLCLLLLPLLLLLHAWRKSSMKNDQADIAPVTNLSAGKRKMK